VAYSPKSSRTCNKQKKKTATCSVDGITVKVSAISTTSKTSTSLSVAWKSTVTSLTWRTTVGCSMRGQQRPGKAIPDRAATSNWNNDRRWRARTQARTPSRVDVSRASYAVCQVDWCWAVKTPEDEGRQLESDPLRNPEPGRMIQFNVLRNYACMSVGATEVQVCRQKAVAMGHRS